MRFDAAESCCAGTEIFCSYAILSWAKAIAVPGGSGRRWSVPDRPSKLRFARPIHWQAFLFRAKLILDRQGFETELRLLAEAGHACLIFPFLVLWTILVRVGLLHCFLSVRLSAWPGDLTTGEVQPRCRLWPSR